MATDAEWYYAERGASKGPVGQSEFDRLVQDGIVTDGTLVWQDGMADWTPLGQMRGRMPLDPATPVGFAAESQNDRATEFGFVASVKDGFRRFFDFESRSNRPQFWYFQLALVLGGFVTGMIDGMAGMADDEVSPFNLLFSIITFLPSIAVAIRRLHDVGKSGWWLFLILIPVVGWLILLVFYVRRGEPDANQWGPPAR